MANSFHTGTAPPPQVKRGRPTKYPFADYAPGTEDNPDGHTYFFVPNAALPKSGKKSITVAASRAGFRVRTKDTPIGVRVWVVENLNGKKK